MITLPDGTEIKKGIRVIHTKGDKATLTGRILPAGSYGNSGGRGPGVECTPDNPKSWIPSEDLPAVNPAYLPGTSVCPVCFLHQEKHPWSAAEITAAYATGQHWYERVVVGPVKVWHIGAGVGGLAVLGTILGVIFKRRK